MQARLPLTFGLLLLAPPAHAQAMSDEALLQRFQQQREAFRAAQTSPFGPPRQLKLITVDDLATTPDLAPPAPTDPAAVGAHPPPGEAATAAAPASAGEGTAILPAGAEPPALAAATRCGGPCPRAGEGPAAQPLVFGQLAPELQVNVRINFPFDSAMLTDDQLPKLAQLCRVMRSSGTGLFRIVGHTDAAGTDLYNERLSLLRAQEVRRYFIETCQLPAERLEAVGLGERILADPADPRGPENRRVELQALS